MYSMIGHCGVGCGVGGGGGGADVVGLVVVVVSLGSGGGGGAGVWSWWWWWWCRCCVQPRVLRPLPWCTAWMDIVEWRVELVVVVMVVPMWWG